MYATSDTATVRGFLPWNGSLVAWGFFAGEYNPSHPLLWQSPDGHEWSAMPLPADLPWSPDQRQYTLGPPDAFAAAVSDEGLLLVNGAGQTWRGTDGVSWTPGRHPAVWTWEDTGDPDLHLLGWRDGFVLWGWQYAASCGDEPCPDHQAVVFVSPDGAAWTPAAPADAFEGAEINAIATGPNGLVAVGQQADGSQPDDVVTAALSWTSPDGVNWTRAPAQPGLDKAVMQRVAAGDQGFVATGLAENQRTTVVWLSPDGAQWQRLPDQRAFVEAEIGAVAFVGDAIVAGGRDLLSSSLAIWASTDHQTWHRVPTVLSLANAGTCGLHALIAGGDGLLVGGCRPTDIGANSALIMTGPLEPVLAAQEDPVIPEPAEGYHWTRLDELSALINDGALGHGVVGPAGAILLGQQGADRLPFVLRSTDGHQWTRFDLPPGTFGGGLPESIESAGPGYVAVGYDISPGGGTDPVIWLSDDGVNWVADPSPTGWLGNAGWADLIRLRGRLLAFGDSIVTSEDGITWTPAEGLPFGATAYYWRGSEGVVVTDGDLNWLSRDGVTWQPLSLPNVTPSDPEEYFIEPSFVEIGPTMVLYSGGYFDYPWLRKMWVSIDGREWTPVDTARAFGQSEDEDLVDFFSRPDGGLVAFGGIWGWSEDHPQPTEIWMSAKGIEWVRQELDPMTWGSSWVEDLIWLRDIPIVIGNNSNSGDPVVWVGDPITQGESTLPIAAVDLPPPAPQPAKPRTPCPPLPDSLEELMALVVGDGARCFGQQPINVNGWYKPPIGDPPVFADPIPWLMDPGDGAIYVAASTTRPIEAWYQVYVGAGAHWPSRRGWYDITGHFNDEAAEECTGFWPTNEVVYEPLEALDLYCRNRFVATEIVRSRP